MRDQKSQMKRSIGCEYKGQLHVCVFSTWATVYSWSLSNESLRAGQEPRLKGSIGNVRRGSGVNAAWCITSHLSPSVLRKPTYLLWKCPSIQVGVSSFLFLYQQPDIVLLLPKHPAPYLIPAAKALEVTLWHLQMQLPTFHHTLKCMLSPVLLILHTPPPYTFFRFLGQWKQLNHSGQS